LLRLLTGTPDTGTPDTGTPDTGTPDTGTADAVPAEGTDSAGPDAVLDPGAGLEADLDIDLHLSAGTVLDPDGDPAPDPAEVSLFVAMDAALREAEERWWADFERGLITDPDPAEDRQPGGSPPPAPPPTSSPPTDTGPADPSAGGSTGSGVGWWAAADRAVEDASRAGYEAQQALAHAQRMVHTAARADAADEAAWRAGPAGRVDAAGDALAALAAAARTDREALAGLLARTAGGGLADRPRIALVDALTGALVSLTDLPELRRTGQCGQPTCRRDPAACPHDLTGRPGLGAPGPTASYRPGAALDRFVRARDRRCRFPGCRRLVAAGELDHRIRHPDGPTAITNLAGFCTTDHRGKHQAPDWVVHLAPDAT
ncbi:HNH endonuclease signature motif containing protein, partial [Modestobacter altitudinis]|uniref:HNH endonuclease signature motif containing protein n=1 Tax=Modestobacter altitudinis TaxID=2213158 RepID=UPI001487364C